MDVVDPDSGKVKTEPSGLGHWRCTCGKSCKVTVTSGALAGPLPAEAVPTPTEVVDAPVQ